ncbi:TPA: hypothetical protein ACWMHC_005054 [Klebsiella pneumoniae]|jgi:hypothetical protein|uniref:hypothetical protein n=1 Tax=Klebsiella pneumoniae TaxID=573 RepID=UPI00324CEBDE|nr:hypothetical protein [Klebsiella pneumoniae]
MTVQAAKDPGKIWLHQEIIDGRLQVVDQDGRIVGGVVKTDTSTQSRGKIATMIIEVEIAAKLDGENIGFVV